VNDFFRGFRFGIGVPLDIRQEKSAFHPDSIEEC
jgi:hypothetical protein